MANVYATKTGNWSDTTVWNTGALPTSSDDVYSNTYTVTIDQDVTVLSIRNTSATSITAGGGFACSTARTVDCSGGTGFVCSTATLLSLTNGAGVSITLKGALTATAGVGISVAGVGGMTLTGAVTSSATSGAIVIAAGGANSTVTVTGNLSTSSNGKAIMVSNGATVNVTGDVSLTSTEANRGVINVDAASTITVTGAVSGSTGGTNQYGINAATTGACSITVTGKLTANSSHAIAGNANTTWTLTGPFVCSSTGLLPFYVFGPIKLSQITNNEFRFKDATTGTASLYSSDVTTGSPTAANVRYGTRYGTSSEFTGTCQVPAAASVLYGVPVDNTTGTASLTSDPQLTPL